MLAFPLSSVTLTYAPTFASSQEPKKHRLRVFDPAPVLAPVLDGMTVPPKKLPEDAFLAFFGPGRPGLTHESGGRQALLRDASPGERMTEHRWVFRTKESPRGLPIAGATALVYQEGAASPSGQAPGGFFRVMTFAVDPSGRGPRAARTIVAQIAGLAGKLGLPVSTDSAPLARLLMQRKAPVVTSASGDTFTFVASPQPTVVFRRIPRPPKGDGEGRGKSRRAA